MTWYAVYDQQSGALYSVGQVVADTPILAAAGRAAVPLTGEPTGLDWDPATHTFVTPPATQNAYPIITWIQRFTAAEFMAIKASNDPNVQFFMFQVQESPEIIPQSQPVQTALAYVVSIGLLTADRAATIGAN